MKAVQTRWGAAAIHLSISFIILLCLGAVIFLWWFPGALFWLSGGLDGLQIVVGVDLVLGPLLTLVVYNISKPRRELVRDLSIIALIQLAGLTAGITLVHKSRPVLISFVYDTFYSYKLADIDEMGIDRDFLDKLPGPYPKVVYVKVPETPANFIAFQMMTTLNNKTPLSMRSDLYRPFPKDEVKRKALLHGVEKTEASGCLKMRIKSVYNQGDICVDPKTFTFSDFKERLITGNSLVGDG